jgi:hypothetical protein
MSQRMRNRLIEILMMLALGLAAALAMPRGYAAMIESDAAVQAPSDRERIKALLARPELARQIEKLGVSPKDAAARVDAMSDTEVAMIAGRLDALTAGGAMSNDQLIIVLLLIVLLAVILL